MPDSTATCRGPSGPTPAAIPCPRRQYSRLALVRSESATDTQVIAYDATKASFAARLWWMLRWVGHRAVAVLDGGFAGVDAGGGALSTASRIGVRAATVHAANRRDGRRADCRAPPKLEHGVARRQDVCWWMPAPPSATPARPSPSIRSPAMYLGRSTTRSSQTSPPMGGSCRPRSLRRRWRERLGRPQRRGGRSRCAARALRPATTC